MKRFLQLVCAAGLAASFIGVDRAVAGGTCKATPKPEFIAGSPPGRRSPVAIATDRKDKNYCVMEADDCVAPSKATVVVSAPSCTCECQ